MSAIASLIAPYLAAMTGQEIDLQSDPVYQGVFGSALEQAAQAAARSTGGGSPSGPSGSGVGSASGYSSGSVLQPGSPLLDTRRGVTLQDAALQSLLEIARRSNILPGAQELGRITDSYRSPAQQAAAYAAKPGLAAPPGTSYHQQGLAVDAGWWSDHPLLVRLLTQAGWNRFSPSGEPWHWSYGVTG